MCGIAGYIRSKPPDEKWLTAVERLILAIEDRGPMATGAAWLNHKNNNEIWQWKGPITAKDALKAKWWKDVLPSHLPRAAIFHTRYPTGDAPAKRNANNHPFHGEFGSLIHNGVLWGEDFVAREHKLTCRTDTDSEVILHMLEKGVREDKDKSLLAGAELAISEISGSMACAYLSDKYSSLLLFKGDSSPLWIANLDESIVFASTKEALDKAFGIYYEFVGDTPLRKTPMGEMQENQVFLVPLPTEGEPVHPLYKRVAKRAAAESRWKEYQHSNYGSHNTGYSGQSHYNNYEWKPCVDCSQETLGNEYTKMSEDGKTEIERRCIACADKFLAMNPDGLSVLYSAKDPTIKRTPIGTKQYYTCKGCDLDMDDKTVMNFNNFLCVKCAHADN